MGTRDQETRFGEKGLDPHAVEYISGLLSDGMIRRSEQVDWANARVVLARAVLERIHRLWRILFGDEWFSMRVSHDEELYQRLRAGLFAQLEGRDTYTRARELARDALSEDLSASDDLAAMDEEIYGVFESGFQRLDAELIRLAIAEGLDPDPADAEVFVVTFDDALNRIEPQVKAIFRNQAIKLGLLQDSPAPEPSTPSSGRRGGRRAIHLEYDVAQRHWWAMADEFENDKETRRPNQRDFCDWLAPRGVHIKERALRTNVERWRSQNLIWPPPRPDAAET